MIQIPGTHVPTIKNRSSKHKFILTRSGIKMLQNWSEKLGIPVYVCPAKPAKAKKPIQTVN